jgi:hypothetical protein
MNGEFQFLRRLPLTYHKWIHLIVGFHHPNGYEGMHRSPLRGVTERPTTYRDRSTSRPELRAVVTPQRPTACCSRQQTEVSSTCRASLLRSAARRPQARDLGALGLRYRSCLLRSPGGPGARRCARYRDCIAASQRGYRNGTGRGQCGG